MKKIVKHPLMGKEVVLTHKNIKIKSFVAACSDKDGISIKPINDKSKWVNEEGSVFCVNLLDQPEQKDRYEYVVEVLSKQKTLNLSIFERKWPQYGIDMASCPFQ